METVTKKSKPNQKQNQIDRYSIKKCKESSAKSCQHLTPQTIKKSKKGEKKASGNMQVVTKVNKESEARKQ
jgi:hypothetical protein